MIALGIGQLTVAGLAPLEYISVAGDAGFDSISLFVNAMGSMDDSNLASWDSCRSLKNQLRSSDLKVVSVECFPVAPSVDVGNYRTLFQLGAELGARSATALLFDVDQSRVIDNLSRMCEFAAETGMRVGVEFMPLAPVGKTIQQAAALVKQIARPNLGIVVDLLHLIRSGGTPGDVAGIDSRLIYGAQLCDGADLRVTEDYLSEASENRLAPSDGVFPIQEFLRALPPGTPIELEVPQRSDRTVGDRLKSLVEATRRQITLAGL